MTRKTDPMETDWPESPGSTAILDEPQFTRNDVLRMTGLTASQLKNTLTRDLVRISGDHNPGTGRRRLFTGGDVLKLEAAHALSGVGIPMRALTTFSDMILTRAHSCLIGFAAERDLRLILYPLPNDDYQIIWASDLREPGPLPVAVSVLHVDQLIDQTVKKLEAVIADEPVPDFTPEPQDDTAGYDFLEWDHDAEGNKVLVGLTREETDEYQALIDAMLKGDDEARGSLRYLDLHAKHDLARRKRVREISLKRLSEADARSFCEAK